MSHSYDASVLFVDDEPEIVEFLAARFESMVSRIHSATHPRDALKIAATNPIDVVVLDINMPGMDGISLLGELKKINPRIQAMFLTGYGDKQNVQDALRLGALDFIDKPFEDKALENCIKRVLEKAIYERLLRDVLELFIYHYSDLDISKFPGLPMQEQEMAIRAALGVAKVKILKKERERP